jgi:hypothetical protein
MSDLSQRLADIRERWPNPLLQCEGWWYSAVRHCQRNMDELCEHNEWPEPEGTPVHPGRYEGAAHAHAGADIAFLLSLIEGGDALAEGETK